jgi:sigma-B regulation protein RsbU (phosphoserine phosphatase)
MVDPQLLRTLKEENADLKLDLSHAKDQNRRLWKVIKDLNELECNLHTFSASSDLLEMIMNILKIALRAVGSENGSILLLDEETEELVFVAVVGDRHQELTDFRIPANTGVAGWVNRTRKSALVPDVRKDNRWISAVDQSIGFHTRSLMAVPLVLGDRVLGVMEIVNALPEAHFNEKDLALIQLVARLASFVFGCTEEALDKNPSPLSGGK